MNQDVGTVLAAIDIIALCTAIGALACLIGIMPRSIGPQYEQRFISLWRVLGACFVLLTINGVILLFFRTHVLSQEPYADLGPILPEVMGQTHFGHVWLIRMTSVAGLWLFWGAGRFRSHKAIWPRLLLAVIAVTAFTRSATGHSADHGDFTPHELLDWLHILLGSLWAGTVVASVITLFGNRNPAGVVSPDFAVMAHRLSALATIALPLVLLTGIFNAFQQFSDIAELWKTSYGRHFLAKMALVTLMLGLGAFNRFSYLGKFPVPSAGGAEALTGDLSAVQELSKEQAFRRVLYLEAAAAIGVFIAVAVMINIAPPHAAGGGMR